MSDLVCTNIESMDIQVQVIDQAIADLQSVVVNLSSEVGVEALEEAGKLADDYLKGEFAESISFCNVERVTSYNKAIFNIEAMVLVLKVYREYLRNGPNGKLVENKQHIKMAPKDMDKQILDLEFSISDVRPKLFNTDYVDGYVRGRRSYLESEIRRKESHQPEPLDASRERYLLSILNYNEKEHGVAIDNIENGISEITVLNSEIEDEIGVLKKEFDDYYKLWNVYDNEDLKVITYNNVNYSLEDIKGLSLSDKLKLQEFINEKIKGMDLSTTEGRAIALQWFINIFLESASSEESTWLYDRISSLFASDTYNSFKFNALAGELISWNLNWDYLIESNPEYAGTIKLIREGLEQNKENTSKTPPPEGLLIDYQHMFYTLSVLLDGSVVADLGVWGQSDDISGWLGDFWTEHKDGNTVNNIDLNSDYMSLLMHDYIINDGKTLSEAFVLAEEEIYSNPIDNEEEFFNRVTDKDNTLLTDEDILDSYCDYANSVSGRNDMLGDLDTPELESFLEEQFDVTIETKSGETGSRWYTWSKNE